METFNTNKNGRGTYYVSLDFVESSSGTDFNRITLDEIQPGGGEKPVSFVRADLKRLSVWGPWIEFPIKIEKPNIMCDYILRMDISGIDKDAASCRGLVGMRKV